ncbi:MAG: glutamate racemase [Candidatus Saganbacteria bacterium]|nr:glutamate racemase [Candidatus Saganbacteria bacterium]
MTPASPLGVFDSGVGGLTVISELMRQLPNEDVIYLADTARVPYGGRSPEEIIKINEEIIPFLIDQGAKLLIIACGTSSAIAYPLLKDKYKVRLIGMVEPGARAALAASRSGRVGLIATVGTVHSHAYQRALAALKKDVQVFAQPCPLFVPLVEGGFVAAEETRRVVKECLRPLIKEEIDTLLLGCTHYPHLFKLLQERVGSRVAIVDPAVEVVREVKQLLRQAGTLKDKSSRPDYKYLVTGSPVQFQDLGSRLLGRPITNARQVKIV